MSRLKRSAAPGTTQPGKPTVDDDTLGANRDALMDCLSCYWPDVGWQLTHATTREELLQALEPLRGHPNRHLLAALTSPTSVSASAEEIRKKREALGKAVERLRDAQTECDRCSDACGQAESAATQARPEQIQAIAAEVARRRAVCEHAESELEAARVAEKTLERELASYEAGFAQDEILMFIEKRFIKGNYARNPLKLANAMAGLPYSSAVPFLGVWQSYVRCSKLDCANWPHFQFQVFDTIAAIWKRYRTSSMSPVEFFREEIRALPKFLPAKISEGPGSKETRERQENYLRHYFVENWAYLRQAIERSVGSPVETDRMPFQIASFFAKIQAAPKTAVDFVLAAQENVEN